LRALRGGSAASRAAVHLVQHEGGLVEGGGVKAALDALQRIGLGLGFLLRVSALRRLLQPATGFAAGPFRASSACGARSRALPGLVQAF
jgi:hypothetical protein